MLCKLKNMACIQNCGCTNWNALNFENESLFCQLSHNPKGISVIGRANIPLGAQHFFARRAKYHIKGLSNLWETSELLQILTNAIIIWIFFTLYNVSSEVPHISVRQPGGMLDQKYYSFLILSFSITVSSNQTWFSIHRSVMKCLAEVFAPLFL